MELSSKITTIILIIQCRRVIIIIINREDISFRSLSIILIRLPSQKTELKYLNNLKPEEREREREKKK
jgi:hypothetical protein